MLLIAYAFKGQVQVFAGRVKIVRHLSRRTCAISKYFCPLICALILVGAGALIWLLLNGVDYARKLKEYNI